MTAELYSEQRGKCQTSAISYLAQDEPSNQKKKNSRERQREKERGGEREKKDLPPMLIRVL